jgi:hypothetical protein
MVNRNDHLRERALVDEALATLGLLSGGLLLPALLVLPAHMLGTWSALAEEVAKGAIVIALVPLFARPLRAFAVSAGMGLLFGVSETVFYSGGAVIGGVATDLAMHLAVIPILHATTALIPAACVVAFGRIRGGIVGIAAAVIAHLLFNAWVGPLFG